MIALEETVAVLLCAGHSRRFEGGDKLLFPLSDKPLVAHAAGMLASLPVVARIATVRPDQDALHGIMKGYGFELIEVGSDMTQQQSARAGIEAALALEPRAICLTLGDMPFVPASHIEALSDAAIETRPATSQGDGWVGPPWIASAEWVGANRSMLKAAISRDAVGVAPPKDVLRDIDCIADLGPGS